MGKTKVVPGSLIALQDAPRVGAEAAVHISDMLRGAVEVRGRAAIALSGGEVQRLAYEALAQDKAINWSKIDVFWVDERAVAPSDPRSHFGQAQPLLAGAAIPAANVHRMPAEMADLAAEAAAYEALIRARVPATFVRAPGMPAFDAIVLGVGDDGHTASLFPGGDAVKETQRLVAAVPAKDGREARLTLTPPVLESARALFVLAVGPSKFEPLERTWEVSGNASEIPARVIRNGRGSTMWLIDRTAGGV